MSGDHVLAPFRRGGFKLLQGGEYVEAYPGLRNPSLFMEVEVGEGEVRHTFSIRKTGLKGNTWRIMVARAFK